MKIGHLFENTMLRARSCYVTGSIGHISEVIAQEGLSLSCRFGAAKCASTQNGREPSYPMSQLTRSFLIYTCKYIYIMNCVYIYNIQINFITLHTLEAVNRIILWFVIIIIAHVSLSRINSI